MVTHEDEIAAYAERIIHFKDGHIQTDLQNGHRVQAAPGHDRRI